MCNVDEDGEKEPVIRQVKSGVGRKCVKCDNPGVLVTRIHDSFCRDCFQVYVVHKFRSAIGKSKLIRDGEKVLVAFSGGTNSAALLSLISDGLSERAHKKLRFIPTLLHVDESTVIDAPEDERKLTQRRIADIMLASGFPSFVTSLEQALAKDISSPSPDDEFYWEAGSDLTDRGIPSIGDQQHLKTLISSLTSTTCKEDFIRNLRRQLIVAIAKTLGLKKVLTGDCSTRLSVQILTDISQGRGSQVALDTAFSDARYADDIMVVRPVRDLNAKELAWYNHLYGVESVTVPSLTTKTHPGASIERLTETFVTGLQADFPSTVSNIVRTSEKLLQPDTREIVKCSFCQSPLDTNVGPSSALNAIRFSKKLSRHSTVQKHDSALGNESGCKNGHGVSPIPDLSALNFDDGETDDDIFSTLCFGCQLSLKDVGDEANNLPSFLQSRAQAFSDRKEMKADISPFLLDDSIS